MLHRLCLWVIALATLAAAAVAQERKPPVPPGRDPGGVAIALLSTGIDYTSPQLAQRLARDGEGELIGWDVEDRDRQPFDRSRGDTRPEWGGDSTAIAGYLGGDGTRLVPVRVNPADPVSLARAVAFVAKTPARVAILPIWGAEREAWEPFRQAASHFKDVLLIVPAGEGSEPVYPAALGLDNVLLVEHGVATAEASGFGGRLQRLSGPALAVAAAGKAASAVLAREPRLDVSALKRRLIEADGDPMWRARK
jgi:hypothetical protein